MIDFIAQYKVFIIPVLVGAIVQIIKYLFYIKKHGWNFKYIMTHGHMPSAHTAFIISLVTSVGLFDDDGIKSGAFAVAVILAIIVIDDAVRLRMYMGDQGRYLNMLIRQLPVDAAQFPRFKERLGHRVSEVIVGGLLGFVLTLVFALILQ
jgi:acid phosphatase family membrane protein YuiD